jgi:hypothetical protein
MLYCCHRMWGIVKTALISPKVSPATAATIIGGGKYQTISGISVKY